VGSETSANINQTLVIHPKIETVKCEYNKYEQLIREMTKGERKTMCNEPEMEKQVKAFKNSMNETE
jgi:hypothetical protein